MTTWSRPWDTVTAVREPAENPAVFSATLPSHLRRGRPKRSKVPERRTFRFPLARTVLLCRLVSTSRRDDLIRTWSGDVLQPAGRNVLERPRHRPGHGEHARLRARRGHRPQRAVDRRDPSGGPLGARRRPRSQGDARAHTGQHRRDPAAEGRRSEEHTSELQSHSDLVCRLLLEKKNNANSELNTLTKLEKLTPLFGRSIEAFLGSYNYS